MSYYSNVEFTFDWDRPDLESVLARARAYLESQGDKYPVDFVLDQLRRGLKTDRGDFKGLYSEDFEDLMGFVSVGFPKFTFFVRGQGEEFSDGWLRVFRDGKIIFQQGPFEVEIESALEG